MCFSFYDNLIKIFHINRAGEATSFNCLNGLRFLMTCWVILGHEFLVRGKTPQLNASLLLIQNVMKTPTMTVAFSALFAVDVFFWLSGFLATISILN